ncbi:MAG: OmpA family protein [Pirellulales bacterium]
MFQIRQSSGAFRVFEVCLFAACLPTAGCMVPAARMAACRSHFKTLNQRAQTLEDQLVRAEDHGRQLEEQLLQAESELGTLDRNGRTNRRRLANFQFERAQLYRRFGSGVAAVVSDQLAGLADRFPSLYYDPASGVAKLDSDVLFDTAHAELQPQARELLGEFAAILRGAEAADLRLMIVGHTDDQIIKGDEASNHFPNNWHLGAARALAVSDFLRVRGVDEQRMGIASYSKYQPIVENSLPGNRQKNRRVEIFIIAPDVPVVGWTESFTNVYR